MSTQTQNITTLKINKLSKQKYDSLSEKKNDEVYLTPQEASPSFKTIKVNTTDIIEATSNQDTVKFSATLPIEISANDKIVTFSVKNAAVGTCGVTTISNEVSENNNSTALTPKAVNTQIDNLFTELTTEYIGNKLTTLAFDSADEATSEGTSIEFIDTINQENGIIKATKKSITRADTATAGIVQLANSIKSSATNRAITPYAVNRTNKEISYQAYCDSLKSMLTAMDGIPTESIAVIPLGTTNLSQEVIPADAKAIIVAPSVTSIGYEAFRGCSSLTRIIIPNSVTSIGAAAFKNCKSLTSIVIPNSVTSIGSGVFNGCSKLTEITIPFVGKEAQKTSGSKPEQYLFGYIFGINSYTGGVKTEQKYSNGNTMSSSYYYYIPSSLKKVTITGGNTLYSGAFYNCSGLTSIVIPNSVTSIGSYAFSGCSGLTSIAIPDSVTSIGDSAFSACRSLTSVVIPYKVTSISSNTFTSCDGLTSIKIPYRVTSIGYHAFYGCRSLTSIEIPDNVTSIGSDAFKNCYNLPYSSESSLRYLGNKNNLYMCLIGTDSYSLKTATINSKCKIMVSGTFDGHSSLKSVVIPNSVTYIGSAMFEDCDSLTEVNYSGSIDNWAQIKFGGSNANPLYYEKQLKINGKVVTEVNLTTATKISDYAFYNCDTLTSIVIPNSVTSIGSDAFSDCDGLTSVVIGNGVTSIGTSAFYSCNKLQFNEYENCKYLGSKDNPYFALIEGVNSNLSSITIHNDTKVIAGRAFSSYSRLTRVVIPDGVTSIGSSAFSSCSSLTSIVIPDSVTSIGESVFWACSRVSINYCGTEDQWNAIYKSTDWDYYASYTINYNYAG